MERGENQHRVGKAGVADASESRRHTQVRGRKHLRRPTGQPRQPRQQPACHGGCAAPHGREYAGRDTCRTAVWARR